MVKKSMRIFFLNLGLLALFGLVPARWLYSQKKNQEYSADEKKAIRREMIEMDIAVRNIGSLISLGSKAPLAENFSSLQKWHTLEHPVHKVGIASVKKKWSATGVLKYKNQIQSTAGTLREYVLGMGKKPEWEKVSKGFTNILANCRGCHQSLMKKD